MTIFSKNIRQWQCQPYAHQRNHEVSMDAEPVALQRLEGEDEEGEGEAGQGQDRQVHLEVEFRILK